MLALLVVTTLLSGALGFSEAWSRDDSRSSAAIVAAPVDTPAAATAGIEDRAKASLATMPLAFIENAGQVQEDVSFLVQGSDTSLGFFDDGVTWRFSGPAVRASSSCGHKEAG